VQRQCKQCPQCARRGSGTQRLRLKSTPNIKTAVESSLYFAFDFQNLDALLLQSADLIRSICITRVLLEVSRFNTQCVQLVQSLEADTFGYSYVSVLCTRKDKTLVGLTLRIQEPSQNRGNQSQTEENEAYFTAQISSILVDLECVSASNCRRVLDQLTMYGIVNCMISPQTPLLIVTNACVTARIFNVATSLASTNPVAPMLSWYTIAQR
jgi:hypothetical protein